MKQNKAVVIGITGPAGCGKSHICKVISEVTEAYIIDTDSIAREQMQKGGCSYREVVSVFGVGILLENGEINRKKLADIVFNDPEKLKKLNSLTHPNVLRECRRIIKAYRDKVSVILYESALLTRAECDKDCDLVWYVYTPAKERAERLKSTRGYSTEKIKSVMRSQDTDSYYRSHCDSVIENRNGVEPGVLAARIKRKLSGLGIK